ncbi:hypothetical protein F5Y03DRAFT_188999 [Xylaria venustula]|nr:hypothetical protein F5Y03DRAFT_188999 [Xylaria venustula]
MKMIVTSIKYAFLMCLLAFSTWDQGLLDMCIDEKWSRIRYQRDLKLLYTGDRSLLNHIRVSSAGLQLFLPSLRSYGDRKVQCTNDRTIISISIFSWGLLPPLLCVDRPFLKAQKSVTSWAKYQVLEIAYKK